MTHSANVAQRQAADDGRDWFAVMGTSFAKVATPLSVLLCLFLFFSAVPFVCVLLPGRNLLPPPSTMSSLPMNGGISRPSAALGRPNGRRALAGDNNFRSQAASVVATADLSGKVSTKTAAVKAKPGKEAATPPLTSKQKRKYRRRCRNRGMCQYCLTAKLCSAASARIASGAFQAADGLCFWRKFASLTELQRIELKQVGYKGRGGACLDETARSTLLDLPSDALTDTNSLDLNEDAEDDAENGHPMRQPTSDPTRHPTRVPTSDPTRVPTVDPTGQPTSSSDKCRTFFQGHCIDT